MSDPARTGPFLEAEVQALEPFDFLVVGPAGKPLQVLELARTEEGNLEVRVPGRPPPVPELAMPVRNALRERGFASEDASDRTRPWVRRASDASDAVATLQRVLAEVFEEKPDVPLDVAHGSRRLEHEAKLRVDAVRGRIEKVLADMLGSAPERDVDGDYVLPLEDVHVTVAPRAAPGGPLLVRIFAITNVGINVVPELGLFLARLNFGLMFGRFALDTDHRAVWFDENLVGEGFTDDELRFVVRVVAATADEWDDRLKQMFGGATYQEVLNGRARENAPTVKPGLGGYV